MATDVDAPGKSYESLVRVKLDGVHNENVPTPFTPG